MRDIDVERFAEAFYNEFTKGQQIVSWQGLSDWARRHYIKASTVALGVAFAPSSPQP